MPKMWYSNITIRFRPDVGRGKSRTLKKKNLRVVQFDRRGFLYFIWHIRLELRADKNIFHKFLVVSGLV